MALERLLEGYLTGVTHTTAIVDLWCVLGWEGSAYTVFSTQLIVK